MCDDILHRATPAERAALPHVGRVDAPAVAVADVEHQKLDTIADLAVPRVRVVPRARTRVRDEHE